MTTKNAHGTCWHHYLQIGFSFLVVIGSLASITPAAATQTPSAGADANGGLATMLAQVPDPLPCLEAANQALIFYADIAGQLSSLGLEAPDDIDSPEFDDWKGATQGLAMPLTSAQYLLKWRDLFGFDLLQADQTLQISSPPFELSLYRGRFDEDAVRRALEDLDYSAIDVEHGTIVTVRDDYELDLGSPARFVLATMNFATILPDGTIAFAPAREIIEAVLQLEADGSRSLADRDDVASLLPHLPADLVSAVIVPGWQLALETANPADMLAPDATPDINAIASQLAEADEMPPVGLAILGTTAGGPLMSLGSATPEPLPPGTPAAQAVVALHMISPRAAEQSVPIIEQRLATGSAVSMDQPFAELFPEQSVEAVPGEPVVLVVLSLGDIPPNILLRLLFNRDLTFIAW
jgi:hypothetical protein